MGGLSGGDFLVGRLRQRAARFSAFSRLLNFLLDQGSHPFSSHGSRLPFCRVE